MKQIFEEYGRTIITVVASIAILAFLFIRFDILGVLGAVTDVNTEISYSQGEAALRDVNSRVKPKANFDDVDLRVYTDCAFRPLTGVVFTDASDTELEVTVTSILYYGLDGNPIEFVDHFNSTDNVLIVNPAHYTDSHETCEAADFREDGEYLMVPDDAEENQNLAGIVTVSYKAIDSENQTTIEKLTFIIDSSRAD